MPDEPLVFVEVALTRGIPNSITGVLACERKPLAAEEADTAVFYSISNCQRGLCGVSFRHFLIKQVARDLAASEPPREVAGSARAVGSQAKSNRSRSITLC